MQLPQFFFSSFFKISAEQVKYNIYTYVYTWAKTKKFTTNFWRINRNQIVFTLFRFILNQTEFRLDKNQSEYDPTTRHIFRLILKQTEFRLVEKRSENVKYILRLRLTFHNEKLNSLFVLSALVCVIKNFYILNLNFSYIFFPTIFFTKLFLVDYKEIYFRVVSE